jgi:hypothetical protein
MDVKSELLLVVLAVVILLWKLDCTCKESDSSIFYYVVITYYRVGDMRWRWNSGCTCFLLVN